MRWSSIIFFVVAACIVTVCEIARRRRLAPILSRSCAGREWRRRFPTASKSDIREFLKLFVDGFALRRKHYLSFRPTDRVMDVYQAINPPSLLAGDGMELEIFAQLLERQYGLALESMWRDDLTLGGIFGRARSG